MLPSGKVRKYGSGTSSGMGTRSDFLAAGAASALTLGAATGPTVAAAATAVPVLDEAAFRARIVTTAKHRQAIGAARVNDAAVLQFAVNTLNGFITGWNEPAANIQVALVLAGSAVTLALDDTAWQAHHLGDILKKFPGEWVTPDASQTNPWAHRSATLAPNADRSIPALLQRGVRIFACNTALGEIANRIVANGTTAGAGNDAFAIQAHLRERIVPGLDVVPAGISALVVLQENGYTYYSAAL
jgi:intracellular sulfur oxidation DsrE/DsrF family protein